MQKLLVYIDESMMVKTDYAHYFHLSKNTRIPKPAPYASNACFMLFG